MILQLLIATPPDSIKAKIKSRLLVGGRIGLIMAPEVLDSLPCRRSIQDILGEQIETIFRMMITQVQYLHTNMNEIQEMTETHPVAGTASISIVAVIPALSLMAIFQKWRVILAKI